MSNTNSETEGIIKGFIVNFELTARAIIELLMLFMAVLIKDFY